MPADTVTEYKELIPSFYSTLFKEQDVLESLLKAVDLMQLQSKHNQTREDRTASHTEADPFDTTIAETLTLTKSSRTSVQYGKAGMKYDGTYDYGQQDPATLNTLYDTGDPKIISIGYIADGVENPTKVYTEGVDFIVHKGLIVFKGKISSLFPDMEASESSESLVDEEGFSLIGYHVRRETNNIYNHYGYALDYGTPTTTVGKEIFNSVWKLFTFGPSWYYTMRALSLSVGSDVVKSSLEKILGSRETEYGEVVVTDRNTYVCGAGSATHTPGTEIAFGYPITKDITVEWDIDRVTDVSNLPSNFVQLDPPDGPYVYQYSSSTYLDPSSLLLISFSSLGSQSDNLKFIEILGEILPKSTRVVLNSTVLATPINNNVISAEIDISVLNVAPLQTTVIIGSGKEIAKAAAHPAPHLGKSTR